MTPIRFIEDTGSYAHRTNANAQWADLTVAIAVDLNTSLTPSTFSYSPK